MKKERFIASLEEMLKFGEQLGQAVKGAEVFELVGDVGTGKTTLVKGLARGLHITDVVQSPTFTINRVYQAPGGLTLFHYDFYRLNEPGIMRQELSESLDESHGVIALEWDDTVHDLLPPERTIRIELHYAGETGRQVTLFVPNQLSYIMEAIE
ncbi:MAG TPA: tRNA (adenosine(37)-N6)-threonylcarbamoyltransferase complex ATPase subunit type 1 TsaE [Candidatus Saccharimonadales bacterium]